MKCKCGNEILSRLGYIDICHYCWREKLMGKSDETIADQLSIEIFRHKDNYLLKEAIRRILLREEKENE